ncbi:MAG: hypothetical protein K6A81_01975 [Clostridiales bacterium]|nr:hypothetical protein [Clostridiales bacterium]
MRTLKSLIEKNKKVWFYCGTEDLQKRFLEQAEKEGFVTMRGDKPSTLSLQRLYGINSEGTMGYISNFIWYLSFQTGNKDILRIDYDSFLSGKENFICHAPKMQPVEITIRRE